MASDGNGGLRCVGGAISGVLWCALLAFASARPAIASEPAGAALYRQYCSSCHDHPAGRIPAREVIAQRSPQQIVQALAGGVMRAQASNLSLADIGAVATFLTGRPVSASAALPPEQNLCAAPGGDVSGGIATGSQWNGWGRDSDNSRYQPEAGLRPDEVPKLALKWAFGYHGSSVYGQPVIVGGRVYVTSEAGRVYSLDAAMGCVYWTFDAAASVHAAVMLGERPLGSGGVSLTAYFGDDSATVYALDAATGRLLWRTKLDDHPMARITGSPMFYAGRLYVAVSSFEEVTAVDPSYECCRFRGSVAALAGESGRVVWQSYVIPESPRPYRRNAQGTQLYGPAGGAIWSAPTIDPSGHVLYVGTGNSYTDITVPTSDAIMAFDLDTGSTRWVRQLTPNDNFVVGCLPTKAMCPVGMSCQVAGEGNCPRSLGDDVDFGSSSILRRLPNGGRILIAAQKSGVVYGLDPDRLGKERWQRRLGAGGALGGVEWGAAADMSQVYVAISDIVTRDNTPPGGLAALRFDTGELSWSLPGAAPNCNWGSKNCSAAQSQAVTVIPGVVFSGSEDGHLRAYSTGSGAVIWDTDTALAFPTVNGVAAGGGSLDGGGPAIVNGVLYVNSGYGRIMGRPGNVLLAFSVAGK